MAFEVYMSSRAQLLTEERSRRRDFNYKANHSPAERQAEAVIRRIRREEADTIWSAKHEDIPHVFPGMEFLTGRLTGSNRKTSILYIDTLLSPGRNIIEKTCLFNIIRKACSA